MNKSATKEVKELKKGKKIVLEGMYRKIAITLDAYKRCLKENNEEWAYKHYKTLIKMQKDLPSGSGIDSGTQIDIENSNGNKIILLTAFHHMNENGYYDGWTEHKIIVKPSLPYTITLNITGRNRNDIKEYLYQIYYDALMG